MSKHAFRAAGVAALVLLPGLVGGGAAHAATLAFERTWGGALISLGLRRAIERR